MCLVIRFILNDTKSYGDITWYNISIFTIARFTWLCFLHEFQSGCHSLINIFTAIESPSLILLLQKLYIDICVDEYIYLAR